LAFVFPGQATHHCW